MTWGCSPTVLGRGRSSPPQNQPVCLSPGKGAPRLQGPQPSPNRGAQPRQHIPPPQQRERYRHQPGDKAPPTPQSPAPEPSTLPEQHSLLIPTILGLQVTGIYWSISLVTWEGDTEPRRWGHGPDPSTVDQDPVGWMGGGPQSECRCSVSSQYHLEHCLPPSPAKLGVPGCHLWVRCNGPTVSAVLGGRSAGRQGREAGGRGPKGHPCKPKSRAGGTPGHPPIPV